MIMRSPYGLALSFEEYATIKTKKGKVITRPRLNPMQREVCEAVAWCLTHRKPVRLIILKPRQKGLSTISTWVLYWAMRVYGTESVLIGGQSAEAKLLWKYFRTYARSDRFPWGFSGNVGAKDANFGNGATCIQETARDEDAGRGGMFTFLLATEAARWKQVKGGVTDADAVLAGILSCVPPLPETFVIMESTAKGPTGFFYDYYQQAVTLEEARAGKWAPNSFIKIFSPWYDHDDSRLLHEEPEDTALRRAVVDVIKGRQTADNAAALDFLAKEREAGKKLVETYKPEERELVKRFKLTPDQIRWYRYAFTTICKSNLSTMKREFPGTEDEAFNASTNQRFSTGAMRVLRSEAATQRALRLDGILEGDKGRYAWVPTETENAMFWRFEEPRPGRNYLISVDTASGEYTSTTDPDKHSVLVLRQGYYDTNTGIWHRHKLVARTIYECRWDIDILDEMVWRLSCYYGKAMIVVESNFGGGLIKGLKDRGAPLYQRSTMDSHGDVRLPKLTGNYGVQMTGGTSGKGSRDYFIENLAKHIREWNSEGMGIEVGCEDLVNELHHFIVASNGKAQAAAGHHDDDVTALAIGMNFIESHATRYVPYATDAPLPRDLEALERQRKGGKRQWS